MLITVIRRFLAKAAKDWLIERSLKDYEEGKITLWQAAERCGLSLWEIIELEDIRKYEKPIKPKRFIPVGGQYIRE